MCRGRDLAERNFGRAATPLAAWLERSPHARVGKRRGTESPPYHLRSPFHSHAHFHSVAAEPRQVFRGPNGLWIAARFRVLSRNSREACAVGSVMSKGLDVSPDAIATRSVNPAALRPGRTRAARQRRSRNRAAPWIGIRVFSVFRGPTSVVWVIGFVFMRVYG